MYDIGTSGWVILAVSAFIIGFSKTGFSGVGILSILLAATVIPSKESTGVILPMLILGDIFAVAFYRRHAVWSHLFKLLPCAATGIVLGRIALGYVTSRQLDPIIGVTILVLLGLSYWRNRAGGELHVPTAWWFPVGIGLLAGVTTMMANAAGPIMVIYLVAMRLPKQEFIGTGAWYFLLLNCFKVPFSADLHLVNPESLRMNLMLAPLIVLGALAGLAAVKHVPQKAFTAVVQILATLGAIYLTIKDVLPSFQQVQTAAAGLWKACL